MRKILSMLAAMASAALVCMAAPVTPQKAREIAGAHFGHPVRTPRMVVDVRAAGSAGQTPSYYIFNGDTGFVIVSGDDCLAPVLAYSPKGSFDAGRIPPGMSAWLNQVDSAVKTLRQAGIEAPAVIRNSWAESGKAAAGADGEGALLELPEWSQENPYNWYCPTIKPYESEKSLTGCVATAISMVMRYHMWPPCGKGTLPGYQMVYYLSTTRTTRIHMPGHALGHEYKWDIMPMEDFYSETLKTPSDGEKQVAWLMYDCGIMMKAEYSWEATGAYSVDIPEAMIKYMYYKGAKYQLRDTYSGDWSELLKDQIDRGLPVLYGADSSDGGHQFVIHGYDASGKFYVNWGWGGDCNGYFSIDYLYAYEGEDLAAMGYTSSQIEKIKASYSFLNNHDAIIDLEPDRSVTPVPVEMDEPVPVVTEEPDTPKGIYMEAGVIAGKYYYYGISLSPSSGPIEPGGSFMLDGGILYNGGNSKYTGYFRFDHTDWQGNYISTIGAYDKTKSIATSGFNFLFDIVCTPSVPYNLGDKIGLYTSEQKDGEYKQVGWLDDGVTVGELPFIPMYFIDPSGEHKLINDTEAFSSVEWSEEGGVLKAVITYADGSTETIVLER